MFLFSTIHNFPKFLRIGENYTKGEARRIYLEVLDGGELKKYEFTFDPGGYSNQPLIKISHSELPKSRLDDYLIDKPVVRTEANSANTPAVVKRTQSAQ